VWSVRFTSGQIVFISSLHPIPHLSFLSRPCRLPLVNPLLPPCLERSCIHKLSVSSLLSCSYAFVGSLVPCFLLDYPTRLLRHLFYDHSYIRLSNAMSVICLDIGILVSPLRSFLGNIYDFYPPHWIPTISVYYLGGDVISRDLVSQTKSAKNAQDRL